MLGMMPNPGTCGCSYIISPLIHLWVSSPSSSTQTKLLVAHQPFGLKAYLWFISPLGLLLTHQPFWVSCGSSAV